MKTNEALRDDIDPVLDPVLDYEVVSVPNAGNEDTIAELVVQRAPETEVRTSYAAARPLSISKRLFDIIGAIAIGILLSPLFLAISVAIRITGSPVIFSHRRVGWNHQPFRCYKFRSMVPNAEQVLADLLRANPKVLQEWRANHKLVDDPRVTRLGAFLRKTSLDELPQLWNVIKGDMSLVGPRPIVADEMERYGDRAHAYCSVRPGMTGLWQISGRSNVTYSRRVSLDMLYIRKQNLRVDLWILWRTAFVVLSRFGAY
jgi:lipopolysaccharide/colanic/teichoic acid biosynthesis glycosyltransferase